VHAPNTEHQKLIMRTQLISRPAHVKWRNNSRGIALIEALVAILIFAIGVLGLVGLQASMTRAQGAGKYRADASNLANEVIGLMWADNPKANGTQLPKYVTANCDSYTPCSDWKKKVANTLPQGTVAITADATNGAVSVTLTWTLPSDGSTLTDSHKYTTSTYVLIN
jgi:type IV pilus assembly protein PilV